MLNTISLDKKYIIQIFNKIVTRSNSLLIKELEKNNIKGLVSSHCDVLIQLFLNNKLSMQDLSRKIHKKNNTMTVLVNKLISLGYVIKTQDEEDRRINFVTLTEKGQKLEYLFDEIANKMVARTYNNISDDEIDELLKTLSKIEKNI